MTAKRISRRTVLRGLGVSMALPWLEAMGPMAAWGSAPDPRNATPNRLAFVYVPNGQNMEDWTPTGVGANFELPAILKPLESFRDDIVVISGLAADKARANGDGNGDHARALAAFLTGAQPRKTGGTDIRVGISADQVAAARIGHLTRMPSLEVGCEPASKPGQCDPGYACVYTSTMSWRSATQPLPKETNPKVVFDRLFSTTPPAERAAASRKRKSILDFVREDSRDLTGKLGVRDKHKLDEYFSTIRELEMRMERAEKLPPIEKPDYAVPEGLPASYEEHIRLMCDLIVLAFQADVTRVATFLVANELSNRPFPFINITDGHHDLSHHGHDEAKKAKIREINIFQARQLAYLLEKLKSIPEGDGTLLDHTMIAYGSGASDGNSHDHSNLPILVAGGGGGTIQTGRHIKLPAETPLNNLWVSLLDRMEIRLDGLGDSNGRIKELEG